MKHKVSLTEIEKKLMIDIIQTELNRLRIYGLSDITKRLDYEQQLRTLLKKLNWR
jgi:hypothetical protein